MACPEDKDLLERWRQSKTKEENDILFKQLMDAGMFPEDTKFIGKWEHQGGIYPDYDDPTFLLKLIKKREFQESKQRPMKDQLEDPPRSSEDFELSPTQRFVSRLLNPRTPYRSALLFHGVGVGKTCAAITICESFLELYPGRKAFVVAPRNIQAGFKRTVFDPEALKMGTGPSENNHHRGCTADTYLSLTNNFLERDKTLIETRVSKVINQRYQFFGYGSFYNYCMKDIWNKSRDEKEKRIRIRERFNNRILIIDEAHNLRDILTEGKDDAVDDSKAQSSDAQEGKRLTPILREILASAEDLTLVLMSATPMYNSYREIIFLMNLLLLNDKRPELLYSDIFKPLSAEFAESEDYDAGKQGKLSTRYSLNGRRLLGLLANHYVSFMRGENPKTFPKRIFPIAPSLITEWPTHGPSGRKIDDDERGAMIKLPCITASFTPETEELYKGYNDELLQNIKDKIGYQIVDPLVQAGNFLFPGEEEDIEGRVGQSGFLNTFQKEKNSKLVQFRNKEDPSWMLEENLAAVSGKCKLLLERLNNCRGVGFIFSRFVMTGALSIALVLEANGYTPYGRELGFLAEGNLHPRGRQCALCPRHEKGHGEVPEEAGVKTHKFVPARYVLLTGNQELSPDNATSIKVARGEANINGEIVKVVIGSQVASEGVDLRFIREIFVYDSWYHLNKLEQVIGRGIRTQSHAKLPPEKRNCTVTLLVNKFENDPMMESIDMYTYRLAMNKAHQVGQVTRVLKEFAMDCSLNRDAIVMSGLPSLPALRDSQGVDRTDPEELEQKDPPFSSLCDYLEDCEYFCHIETRRPDGPRLMPSAIPLEKQDLSTYDEYTARFQIRNIKKYIEEIFRTKEQVFMSFETIAQQFEIIPRAILASLLYEMINNPNYKIRTNHGEGRLVYKNGFYIFQPDAIKDQKIPIAIRVSTFVVPKDRYDAVAIEREAPERSMPGAAETDGSDMTKMWAEFLAWYQTIESGEYMKNVREKRIKRLYPQPLYDEINSLPEYRGAYVTIQERLNVWIDIFMSIENPDYNSTIANCFIQHIWDMWLSPGTRRKLLLENWQDPLYREIAGDSFWDVGAEEDMRTYLRIWNSNTNEIEYYCPKGGVMTKCSDASKEELEERKNEDPLLTVDGNPGKPFQLNTNTTGENYGLIGWSEKKKNVFKHGRTPEPGKKLGLGAECQGISQAGKIRTMLKTFGERIYSYDYEKLILDDRVDMIANTVRLCVLSEFCFRYMDIIGMEDKRWFFRGLATKLLGHPISKV